MCSRRSAGFPIIGAKILRTRRPSGDEHVGIGARQGRSAHPRPPADPCPRHHGRVVCGGAAFAGAVQPAPPPASASSSTSTQCFTGVGVPLCRCWMQPMLAETMHSAPSGSPGGRACGRAAGGPARAAARCRCRPSHSTGGSRWPPAGCRSPSSRSALLDAAAQLLAMLQRARRVVGQPRPGAALQARLQCRHHAGQQLRQVARELADAARLVGIGRVAGQQVAIVLDGDAAARGVHHDGLDAAFAGQALDQRPPGVDVGAHLGFAAFLVVEVKLDRAAAAAPWAPSRSGCRRRPARGRWRC
jgi:hypothetical protein